jgi:hypothetical protein
VLLSAVHFAHLPTSLLSLVLMISASRDRRRSMPRRPQADSASVHHAVGYIFPLSSAGPPGPPATLARAFPRTAFHRHFAPAFITAGAGFRDLIGGSVPSPIITQRAFDHEWSCDSGEPGCIRRACFLLRRVCAAGVLLGSRQSRPSRTPTEE